MTTVQVQPDQAQRLFEAGGFFILPLDTQGTEFGVDGSLWVVKQDTFAGLKFLPPGLHLFVHSAPPSSTSLAAQGLPTSVSASTSSATGNLFGEGITIRHGLFRFSQPKEVFVRKYDMLSEEVEHEQETIDQMTDTETPEQDFSSERSGPSTAKRARVEPTTQSGSINTVANQSSTQRTGVSDTVVSQDYLKTLDPKLAPYPLEKLAEWRGLTSLITQKTLERVLGQDSNGDSRCDALMSSLADENEGTPASSNAQGEPGSAKQSQWGKKRAVNELDAMYEQEGKDDTDPEAGAVAMSIEDQSVLSSSSQGQRQRRIKQNCMCFASFNLKKSWRPGAVGEEITRDSRDKSWLLSSVVQTQTKGSEDEFLAEMQLAFVIFTQLQNFSALESYKAYLSLLCRSSSTFLPSSSGLSLERSLRLYARFLELVLQVHIDYLRTDFFSEDLPSFDTFICEELAVLRMSLRAAYRVYEGQTTDTTATHDSQTSKSRPDDTSNLFRQVHVAWNKLKKSSESKFGWQLGGLEPDDMTIHRQYRGRLQYNLLTEPDDEDEYREEGEDAPVVVEL